MAVSGPRALLSSGVCHCDDELSLGVSRLEVTHGFGRLAQQVGLVDDRGELAGPDELGETLEVGLALSEVSMVSRWRTDGEGASARSWRPIPVHRPPASR